jgi:hypothetical protein
VIALALACTQPGADAAATGSPARGSPWDSGYVPGPDDSDTDSLPDSPPDTGDGGTGDSGDSADTAEPTFSADVFGADDGIPVGITWRGLDIDPSGRAWAATTAGLLVVDPATRTTYTFTSADGLLTDAPFSVAAARDGTGWVGHYGTTARQGEQVTVSAGGDLAVVQDLVISASMEVVAVYRMREDRDAVGLGNIWMGTNEGLCLWDEAYSKFDEHAHPTHPHSVTLGVGFTGEGDAWNADQYQLSRWRYSNDGDIGSSDLYEYWVPFPVGLEEPIGSTDFDADGSEAWLSSSLFGVAVSTIGVEVGTSTTEVLPEPTTALSVRLDGHGNAWVGTTGGPWIFDVATRTGGPVSTDWLPATDVQQIAIEPRTGVTWLATSGGLVRIEGVPS